MKHLDHDVILDLLPLYADDCCSTATRRLVETHLQTCPECQAALAAMRGPLPQAEQPAPPPDPVQEEKVLVNTFKKVRRRWAASLLAVLMLLPLTGVAVLAYHEWTGSGVAFTNIDDMLRAESYLRALQVGDTERSFTYIDVEGTLANWRKPEVAEAPPYTFDEYVPVEIDGVAYCISPAAAYTYDTLRTQNTDTARLWAGLTDGDIARFCPADVLRPMLDNEWDLARVYGYEEPPAMGTGDWTWLWDRPLFGGLYGQAAAGEIQSVTVDGVEYWYDSYGEDWLRMLWNSSLIPQSCLEAVKADYQKAQQAEAQRWSDIGARLASLAEEQFTARAQEVYLTSALPLADGTIAITGWQRQRMYKVGEGWTQCMAVTYTYRNAVWTEELYLESNGSRFTVYNGERIPGTQPKGSRLSVLADTAEPGLLNLGDWTHTLWAEFAEPGQNG